MYQSILKECLQNEFYNVNKSKLRSSIFDDESKDIYETIKIMHEKFDRDISPSELFTFWKSQNPTSTGSWTEQIEDLINNITTSDCLNHEIAGDVISNLWRQHIGLDIANLGIRMSEGSVEAMDELNVLLAKVADGYTPDNFESSVVTDDIYEMLAAVSDANRFKFNIESLSKHVYGIARGEFGVIAAYSNVGKTTFAVSLCAGPGGFCQQGAKVGYIANEEIGKKTKLRAVQAYAGMSVEQIEFDPPKAAAVFSGIKDKLVVVNAQDWDVQKLDAYLTKEKFDLVKI